MVIDTFPFFNELDMLYLHLEHYKSLVDATVLVESMYTFSGKQKPMYFHQNKNYFKGYNIVWTKYNPGHEPNVWFREFGQRDKAREAVKWSQNDIVLINDVDEFVNLETLERVLMGMEQLEEAASAMCFVMDHYQGTFKYKLEEPWPGTVILPLRSMKYKFSTYRDNRARLPLIQNGGWHLSYFGGVERIQQKVEAYSHLEKNTPEINNTERISKALLDGTRII
jgi:beta-1,4-mannosyl-glycoprotein beta-1,4-N-acetylglucosaminyltransferase